MARPLRILHPGAWYHLTARGIERRALFRDDRDRAHFLELLKELVARFDVALNAFVLMDNHYPLLLETRRPNLSRAIQWLNNCGTGWRWVAPDFGANSKSRRAGRRSRGRLGPLAAGEGGLGAGGGGGGKVPWATLGGFP